ncbi:D-allose kinase [compost metagenome]
MNKYMIGIDLGGTNIKSAVFDTAFNVVEERSDPTEADKGPAHVLNKMKVIISEMLGASGIRPESVVCMGMGIPGLLDPEIGLSIFSPNFPEWENVHVVREMSRDFPFPIFIDNDVRVICMASGSSALEPDTRIWFCLPLEPGSVQEL